MIYLKKFLNYFKILSGIALVGLLIADSMLYWQQIQIQSDSIKQTVQPLIRNEISVYISGAVKKPGVYNIGASSRIVELLDLAGGVTSSVDMLKFHQTLNLAAEMSDAQHIFIPVLAQEANTQSSSPTQAPKISINTGSIAELMQIPGVGEATAQLIIEARPFTTLVELKNVKGIGDKTYEKLLEYIAL